MDIEAFRREAKNSESLNRKVYRKLKARPPKDLDDHFHNAHKEVFERTDCLQCANCCKTTSPIFYQRDIDRAAKSLKLKPGQFISTYLRVDDEGDLVLKKAPCPFLDQDNYCTIYEDRPQACREYPHTNRKRMYQILDLTMRNTLVCPAVLNITGKVKESLGF